MTYDLKKIELFPASAGVYLMKTGEGKVLYVGKAINLRQRIKQYFVPGRDGRLIVPYLTTHIEDIDVIIVDSEKEALLLENTLIKKYQPKYNALLKDDKSFFSIKINHTHCWPMVRVVRYKGKPPSDGIYFGPYTNAYAARQTLELLRRLFPLRQCSDHELVSRTRPCILYELKRCIAPCVAKCTKDEYDRLVDKVVKFLKGQDREIIKDLYREMEQASADLKFEAAATIYQKIQYIETTLENQKVDKAGTRDLDVLALYREADEVILTQITYREGKLFGANDYTFSHNAQDDDEIIHSFLLQHYGEMEEMPYEIVLPLDLKNSAIIESILSQNKKHKTHLIFPQKGDKKALLEMALKNAISKFTRLQSNKNVKERILLDMEEQFKLLNFPEKIECFDNSNISGTEPVSSMVVYIHGEKSPKSYRKYKIKQAGASDDYAAMKEVLTRRYIRAKEEDNLPDLILIDGGKGHLNLAIDVLSQLDISTVDVISIAKEEGRHDRGVTAEKIFTTNAKEPILLKPHSPMLFLLQQIRDEAHRVAIGFQRQRRNKRSLGSALDEIPGIGPIKRQRLLRHFGSFKRILAATDEELLAIKGILKKDIIAIRKKQI